jgi:hypothetical protein
MVFFSPLRHKTSELEGEEYTSRIVSGIDRLDPPLVSVYAPHLGKPESLLIGSRKSSSAVDGVTAAQTLGQCNKSLVQPSSRWRHRSTNIRPM